jgi:hypothetical protein
VNTQEILHLEAPEAPEDLDPVGEAMAAVKVGLYVSAIRCLFTYVIAPAAGTAGVFLGSVGFVLLVLGAITSTVGARRLWVLDRRARIPYLVVATAVDVLAVLAVLDLAKDSL